MEINCPQCKTAYNVLDEKFSSPVLNYTCRICDRKMIVRRDSGHVEPVVRPFIPLLRYSIVGILVFGFLIGLGLATIYPVGSSLQTAGGIFVLLGALSAVTGGIYVLLRARQCPVCGSFRRLRRTRGFFGPKVDLTCSVCNLITIRKQGFD